MSLFRIRYVGFGRNSISAHKEIMIIIDLILSLPAPNYKGWKEKLILVDR
jgi:hypothetical protein